MTRLPVRRMIHEELFASRPDFEVFDGPSPYNYRRIRRAGGESFYDLVLISSSQKHRLFDVGVITGFFPWWHGTGEMQLGFALPILCGRTAMADMVYEHDGSEAGARAALRVIAADLVGTAEPWFEQRSRYALEHPLIRLGLEWIRSHPEATTAKDGLRYDESVRGELSLILRRRARELDLAPAIKKDISLLCYNLLAFASEVDGRPMT